MHYTQTLTETQIQAIHSSALTVLERTGYDVPVLSMRERLHKAGARVEGQRVWIPARLVEQALESMRPARVYTRTGELSPTLKPGHVSFGGLADTFYVVDPYTRKAKPYCKADQPWFTTVLDALPHIEWLQVGGQSHDVPDDLQTQVALVHTIQHTTKPILVYPYDKQGLLDCLDVIYAVAGSEAAYREKPSLMCASVPAAPLSGTDYSIELLMACAEYEIPLLHYSCPAVGGNSPSTLVGALVLATADWLAGLAMHQLVRPGAPVCTFGYTMQLMEMRTLIWAYSAPEMQLAAGAVADLARYYGLPAWGITVEPDNAELNAQAGVEMTGSCLRSLLSGVEMIHNIGRIGAGRSSAAEAAVLADEIIAYCKASVQPFPFAPESLSEVVDLIDAVGPLGEYITQEHTLRHFRDFMYPKVFDRSTFDPLAVSDGTGLLDRLNSRVRAILESHQPEPLSDHVLDAINKLEQSWYERIR